MIKTDSRRSRIYEETYDKENELVIKNLYIKTHQGLGGFIGEFYQTFKEATILILHKLFQKVEEEGALSSSFCEGSITLIKLKIA